MQTYKLIRKNFIDFHREKNSEFCFARFANKFLCATEEKQQQQQEID